MISKLLLVVLLGAMPSFVQAFGKDFSPITTLGDDFLEEHRKEREEPLSCGRCKGKKKHSIT